MREAWEPDYSNFGLMLESIGGWTVDCEYHHENLAAVDRAISEGLVGTRIHYAPIDHSGDWKCFELTDAGIEKVLELQGERAAECASTMRQRYRDNVVKYIEVTNGNSR